MHMCTGSRRRARRARALCSSTCGAAQGEEADLERVVAIVAGRYALAADVSGLPTTHVVVATSPALLNLRRINKLAPTKQNAHMHN